MVGKIKRKKGGMVSDKIRLMNRGEGSYRRIQGGSNKSQ